MGDEYEIQKMDINEKFVGKGFFIFDWNENDANLVISGKSERRKIKYPYCGYYIESLHSNYHRRIQIVPMKGKNTILDVVANKYDCLNENCPNTVIVEPHPFAAWKKRRTIELDCLVALCFSNASINLLKKGIFSKVNSSFNFFSIYLYYI